MKVFIIGIRGFLGSNLARALEARGHEVRGSTREAIRIGDPVDPVLFEDTDTIVHCAHDFRAGAWERNVTGARLLFDAARGKRRIFISSHSARRDAVSEYGISKYRIERLYLGEEETVVRPGLVIGAGGLFGHYLRTLRSLRVIPLVDGGRDLVPVLAIADFSAAMVNLIESGRSGTYNFFNETMPRMREIVDTVLRLAGHSALLVSIPNGLASALVTVAERCKLPLPFDSGSLRALKLNRDCVHQSNLRELLDRETPLETAIALSLA
jgi:nucleoside-diphosphate-sugar epimerase